MILPAPQTHTLELLHSGVDRAELQKRDRSSAKHSSLETTYRNYGLELSLVIIGTVKCFGLLMCDGMRPVEFLWWLLGKDANGAAADNPPHVSYSCKCHQSCCGSPRLAATFLWVTTAAHIRDLPT